MTEEEQKLAEKLLQAAMASDSVEEITEYIRSYHGLLSAAHLRQKICTFSNPLSIP